MGEVLFQEVTINKRFFKTWNESFKRHNSPYDQISLNESLFASRVRVLPLTSEWNYFQILIILRKSKKSNYPSLLHKSNFLCN